MDGGYRDNETTWFRRKMECRNPKRLGVLTTVLPPFHPHLGLSIGLSLSVFLSCISLSLNTQRRPFFTPSPTPSILHLIHFSPSLHPDSTAIPTSTLSPKTPPGLGSRKIDICAPLALLSSDSEPSLHRSRVICGDHFKHLVNHLGPPKEP